MKVIDMLGKPCPIPVIEAKKALAAREVDKVLLRVDNFVAVQNLEKMARGYQLSFSFDEIAGDSYEVRIAKKDSSLPVKPSTGVGAAVGARDASDVKASSSTSTAAPAEGVTVVLGKDTLGAGAEELGKILIKGFIYSLTELPVAPKQLLCFNAGVRLAAKNSNTVDDLRKLEEAGTEVLLCGTCVNFYELQEEVAVGSITDMYGITSRLAEARSVITV